MRVLLLETVHEDARRILEEAGEVFLIDSLGEEKIREACGTAAAVLTRGRGRISEGALAAGSNLRCVARCGAGTDNIDVREATLRGIPVIYNPDSMSSTVAEHAILLALAVGRQLAFLDRAVKENRWGVREEIPPGIELRGKTLGVLGLGRIGTRVAELGHAFGMDVIYWSRSRRDSRFQQVSKEELFRRADILTIHVPLTPETRCIVDEEALRAMKPASILINTSRGAVVDEQALTAALERGAIGGAGLDVMAAEPPMENHPLLKLRNTVITPHIAGVTDRAFRKTCVEVAEQVMRVLQGGMPNPHFVRNPETLQSLRRLS